MSKDSFHAMDSLNFNGPLKGIRVLDFTDRKGWLCGMLFGLLGATVIKIETPSGDKDRNCPPFLYNTPDVNNSIWWRVYNLNKFGITLDYEREETHNILQNMFGKVDIVIESFESTWLNEKGYLVEKLADHNTELIWISISPFGRKGPYSKYRADDLELLGLGNVLYQQGDEDRPPVRASIPQAFLHGAIEGAIGGMFALLNRTYSKNRQFIDVSCQESVATTSMFLRAHAEATGNIVKRSGSRSRWRGSSGSGPRVIYQCKDGFFCYTLFGGAQGEKSNKALTDWMAEENANVSLLHEIDWSAFNYDELTQEQIDSITDIFGAFFLNKTKQELYNNCLKRNIMGVPVRNIADIFQDEQLKDRDYWVYFKDQNTNIILIYPGAFAKMSKTPIEVVKEAPRIGENNDEVYLQLFQINSLDYERFRKAGLI